MFESCTSGSLEQEAGGRERKIGRKTKSRPGPNEIVNVFLRMKAKGEIEIIINYYHETSSINWLLLMLLAAVTTAST